MTRAFKCDICHEFHEGRPHKYLGWGPTEDSASSRTDDEGEPNRALCESCFQDFIEDFIERGHE